MSEREKFEPRESVIRLAEGQPAEPGIKIVRILGQTSERVGPGTNWRTVYVVAVEKEYPGDSPLG